MKALAALLVVAACGTDHYKPPPDAGGGGQPYTACSGDAASFVRQSFLALDGRRPLGQPEVDVYVDLYAAAAAKGIDPKETVARAIMARPEFAERWIDVTMDALRVQRTDIQGEAACWDKGQRTGVDPTLATMVRDQAANGAGDGHPWTMIDLARSAMALDDVSPVFRAQLFSMVSHPIPAANVGAVEAELARRDDFGDTFDSGYLHRDIVCLSCHNSERSVTDNDDPAKDRFWPVPGLPEKGIYGDSTGVAPDRAHAMFRVDGFVVDRGSGARPWGWASTCGQFTPSVPDDIAGVDAKLATIAGKRSTVYDLEGSLKRGFDALRGKEPPIGPDGSIADPDTALAWLVTLKFTEDVWKASVGTPLTIANYFPRNKAASDELYALATKFTQSGFSVRALLVAIVESDYFNRLPAEAGCGDSPYTYPAIYDPWVIADPDPAKRMNGPGDAVTAIDGRTLVSATSAALGWSAPPQASRFPDYGDPGCEEESCSDMATDCSQFGACCEAKTACQMGGVLPSVEIPFERGVGMFLRNSERGFRGLDFQARLVWENRYGACTRPAWVQSDFIDDLIAAAAMDPSATAQDVVLALKDRLIGDSSLVFDSEKTALAAVVGPLDAPATAVTADAARQLCGALLETPQFLLQGIAGHGGTAPKLSLVTYNKVCMDVAAAVPGATCTGGKVALQ
jgi:hypothetical protein